MTQVVSNQCSWVSSRIGFSRKSLRARREEFRARAGVLGRADIIAAFNAHPAHNYGYNAKIGFLNRVTEILVKNPDQALKYLLARKPVLSAGMLYDQYARVRSKAKGKQDKEPQHVASALALADPCADLEER